MGLQLLEKHNQRVIDDRFTEVREFIKAQPLNAQEAAILFTWRRLTSAAVIDEPSDLTQR